MLRRSTVVVLTGLFWLTSFSPALGKDSLIEVRGSIRCESGRVRDPWLEMSGGGRFVDIMRTDTHVGFWSTKISSSRFPLRISIHAGCGGADDEPWGSDNYSPKRKLERYSTTSTATTTTLNVICTGRSGGTNPDGCRYPDAGPPNSRSSDISRFPKYQCTYGAAKKSMSATRYTAAAKGVGLSSKGFFPNASCINGNAGKWNDAAKACGLDVWESNPVARSVVVFEGGINGFPASGHVGFVYRIERVLVGSVYKFKVYYTDMNWDNTGTNPNYANHWAYHDDDSMSYILLAAPGLSV